jgi:hypothetical protein
MNSAVSMYNNYKSFLRNVKKILPLPIVPIRGMAWGTLDAKWDFSDGSCLSMY